MLLFIVLFMYNKLNKYNVTLYNYYIINVILLSISSYKACLQIFILLYCPLGLYVCPHLLYNSYLDYDI